MIFNIQDSDIEIAQGTDLEVIGERYGVIRKKSAGFSLYGDYPETDADYRERIKASMPITFNNGRVFDSVVNFESPKEKSVEELAKERKQQMTDFFFPNKNVRNCECGVWLIGYIEAGPNHSSFCRLHRKDMGGW